MKKFMRFILIFLLLYLAGSLCLDRFVFPKDIIGTYYEVPLPNHHQLEAFDVKYGCIVDTEIDETMVDEIDSLQIIGNYVIGSIPKYTESGAKGINFFVYDTTTDKTTLYDTLEQLSKAEAIPDISFTTTIDYYWKHRRPADIFLVLACVMVSFAYSSSRNHK